MKKALSLFLTAALAVSLGAPALAAEAADARLAAVTQTVKATLGIDTEQYEQFYGELDENALAPTWSLSWSGAEGNLNVTADQDGKVLSYYRYDEEESWDSEAPAFPSFTEADAREAALDFLNRVLDKGVETAGLEEADASGSLNAQRYYFSGTLDLNGLPSPFYFSISVRPSDGAVVGFDRDGLTGRYQGGIPSAKPAADGDKAAKDLAGTLSLRLEYVLAEDGKSALLRYLPNPVDEYYVDGQTGALVNLSQRYRDLASGDRGSLSGGGSAEAVTTADASAKRNLSAAEQQGVEKLEGVLSKEALDQKTRAVKELGLSQYTLADASYSVERQDKDVPASDAKVTARLTYARQDGDQVWRRFVTVDAKTGALISVSSSIPYVEGAKAAVKEDAAQKKAEAFLNAYYKDEFGACAPYEAPSRTIWAVSESADPRTWSFHYAQKEKGYFFPSNNLSVSIDASDGSVSAFSRDYDGGITFESPEGVISQEEAAQAYAASFDSVLGYVQVPQALDLAAPDVRPLLSSLGVNYFYGLKLGYVLESNVDGRLKGIDAKTGKPVVEKASQADALTYDDLEGHWVQSAAQSLAEYGVGWTGGSMAPDAKLTQLELVALLVSVRDGATDPAKLTQEEADLLYQRAYQNGILTKGNREDAKVVTRLDIVELLLNLGGYGPAAGLRGIYRCDFADADAIPQAALGYVALAQGLGLVTGDGAGNFAPQREATRAEAVSMLYHFMDR